MEKIHIQSFIQAQRKRVWDSMLSDSSYREWTKAFNSTSRYVGEWKTGSKMLFLGTDPQTGKEMGMVSRIKEVRPYEFVSIEHLGIYADGIEDTQSELAKKWAPAYENYTFADKDGGTMLVIDMDVSAEEKEGMERLWQEGVKRLKALAEK